jgi:hypothetical protein
MNKVRKIFWDVLPIVIGITIGFFATMALIGCNGHNGSNKGIKGNRYLKDVFIDPENRVSVVIELPENHYGLLILTGDIVALPIVGSGTVEAGVFQPGDYEYCLELYLRPDVLNPLKDLSGVTECIAFTVPVLDLVPIPEPGPGPDPQGRDKPTLTCSSNEDGAVTLIVEFNSFSSPVILRKLFSEEDDIVLEGNVTLTDIPLVPGEYLFRLLDLGTLEELSKCVLLIPAPPGHEDEEELPELPPKPEDPNTKFLVCHNGHPILVPWR